MTDTAQLFQVFSGLIAAGAPSEAPPKADRVASGAAAAGTAAWAYCHTGGGDATATTTILKSSTVFQRSDALAAFLVVAVNSGLIPASVAPPTAAANTTVPAATVAVAPSVDNTIALIVEAIRRAAATAEPSNPTDASASDAAEGSPAFTLRVLSTVLLKAFAAIPWCAFLSNASGEIKQLQTSEKERPAAGAPQQQPPASIWAALPPPPRRPTLSAATEAELAAVRKSSSAVATADVADHHLPPLVNIEASATSHAAPPMIVSDATVKAICTGLFSGAPIIGGPINKQLSAATDAASPISSTSSSAVPPAASPQPSAPTTAANNNNSAVVADWFTQKLQQLYRPRRVDQMYRSSLLLLPKGPIVAAAMQQQASSPSASSPLSGGAAAAQPTSTQQFKSSQSYVQCDAIAGALEAYLASLAAEAEASIRLTKAKSKKQQQQQHSAIRSATVAADASSARRREALSLLRAACGLFIDTASSAEGGATPSFFLPAHPVTFFWCCLSTMLTPTTSSAGRGFGAIAGMDLVDLYELVFEPTGALRDEMRRAAAGGGSEGSGASDEANDDDAEAFEPAAADGGDGAPQLRPPGPKAAHRQRLVGALAQACSLLLSELFGLSMGALRQLYFMQRPRAARNVTTNHSSSSSSSPSSSSSAPAPPIISTQQLWFAEYGRMAPHFQLLKLVEGIVSDLFLYPPALAIQTHSAAGAPLSTTTTAASAAPAAGAGSGAAAVLPPPPAVTAPVIDSGFGCVYIPPTATPLVLPLHVRSMLFVELHTRIDEILIACGSGAFSANLPSSFAPVPITAAPPPPQPQPVAAASSQQGGGGGAPSAVAAAAMVQQKQQQQQQLPLAQVASNFAIPPARLDAALALSLQVPYSAVSGVPIQTMNLGASSTVVTTVQSKSLVAAHIVHGLQQWARVSEGTLVFAAVANASSCVAAPTTAASQDGGAGSNNTLAGSAVPTLPTGERFFSIEHPCPPPLLPTATVAGIKPASFISPTNAGVTIVGGGNGQLVEPTWGDYFSNSYAAPVSGASVSGISAFLSPFSAAADGTNSSSGGSSAVAGNNTIAATQHTNVASQMPLFAKVWPILFFTEMLQRGLFGAAAGFAEALMGVSSPATSSSAPSLPASATATAAAANASFAPSHANAMNLLSQYVRHRFTGSSSLHLNLFLFPTRTAVGVSHVLPAAAACAALNPPPSQQAGAGNNNSSSNNSNANRGGAGVGVGGGNVNTTHTTPFVHSFVGALEDIMEGPSPFVTPIVTSTTTISGTMASTTQTVAIPPFAPPATNAVVFNAQAQIASILEKFVIGKILSVAAGPSAVAAATAATAVSATPATGSGAASSTTTTTAAAAALASSAREAFNEVYTQLSAMLPLLSLAQSYIAAPTLVCNFLEALAVMVRVEGQLNYFDFVARCASKKKQNDADDEQKGLPEAVSASVAAVRRQLSYLLSTKHVATAANAAVVASEEDGSNSDDDDEAEHASIPSASERPSSWKWALLACELFVAVLGPCMRRQKSPSLPVMDALEELLMALEEPHVVTMRPQKMVGAFPSSSASSFTGVSAATSSASLATDSFWAGIAAAAIAAEKVITPQTSSASSTGGGAAQLTPSAAVVRTATERILLQMLRERVPNAWGRWGKKKTGSDASPSAFAIFTHSKSSSSESEADGALEALLGVVPEFTPPTFVTADLFCVPAVFLGDKFRQNKAFRESIADPSSPFFVKRSLRDREKLLASDPSLEFATLRYPHDHVRYVERAALFGQCLRRLTSDNVHQYNLTLRTAVLAEPAMVISKLISQVLGNDDMEVAFCQAQLLQGVPRAVLRTFVVMVLDKMFAVAAEEQPTADKQVRLLGSLLAFVWAQNSSGFGSLSFSSVPSSASQHTTTATSGNAKSTTTAAPQQQQQQQPFAVANGRSGCAAYVFRRMLRALKTNRTSTVLFVCELLNSLCVHMLHETLESEAQYTHQQLNALTCLPTSRWFASAAASSFLTAKWFDPQTMLLQKGGGGVAGGAQQQQQQQQRMNSALLAGPLTGGGGGGNNNMPNNNGGNSGNGVLGGGFHTQQMSAQMIAARDAERKAAADDAAAFGFMSSVFSSESNLRPMPVGGSSSSNNKGGALVSSSSADSNAAFSYLNFIFSASFSPLTLYQCRVRFCEALAEPFDLNRRWAAAARAVVATAASASAESREAVSVSVSDIDTTTVGEALVGRLTSLHAGVYALFSDYPSASIERELTLAATYANRLNDLVLCLVALQAGYGGRGILRHEAGRGYLFYAGGIGLNNAPPQQSISANASASAGSCSGEDSTLLGISGLLRVPPAASAFAHLYSRCRLLLQEGRGENATATLNFRGLCGAGAAFSAAAKGSSSAAGNSATGSPTSNKSDAAVGLATVAGRVASIVWGITATDVAYSEAAYVTAVRQLLLFVRQAMMGRTEGAGAALKANANNNSNTVGNNNANNMRGGQNNQNQQNVAAAAAASPAYVTTATGGAIPAATAARIAALVGVSDVDRAAMEADAEIIEYISGREKEEEARLRSLFNDKALARGKSDGAGANGDAVASVGGGAQNQQAAASATTAANNNNASSPTNRQQRSQQQNAFGGAYLYPNTIDVVDRVLAAKWLRLEQKVLIRLLLEQKDRIVAEARHHARLIGIAPSGANNSNSNAAIGTGVAMSGLAAAAAPAVAELYALLFATRIDTTSLTAEAGTGTADDDDDNAKKNSGEANASSAASAEMDELTSRQALHTAVAHDILAPRTLLSTQDAIAVAALLESLYGLHMLKAAERADAAALLMRKSAAEEAAKEQQQQQQQQQGGSTSATNNTKASSSSVNVEEIIRQGATDKAEQEFLGLVFTYVTAVLTFLPSYTDSEARRVTTALQRLFVLVHKSKLRRAVSQFVALNTTSTAENTASAAAATAGSSAAAAAEAADEKEKKQQQQSAAPPNVTAAMLPPSVSLSSVLRSTEKVCIGIKRNRDEADEAANANTAPTTSSAPASPTTQAAATQAAAAAAPPTSAASPIETVLAPTALDSYLLQLFVQILAECAPARAQREDGSATILRNVFHMLGMLKTEVRHWVTTDDLLRSSSGGASSAQQRPLAPGEEPQLRLAINPPAIIAGGVGGGVATSANTTGASRTAASSAAVASQQQQQQPIAAFASAAAEALAPVGLFPSSPSHIRQLLAAVKRHVVSSSAQFAAASSMQVAYQRSITVAADAPKRWAVAMRGGPSATATTSNGNTSAADAAANAGGGPAAKRGARTEGSEGGIGGGGGGRSSRRSGRSGGGGNGGQQNRRGGGASSAAQQPPAGGGHHNSSGGGHQSGGGHRYNRGGQHQQQQAPRRL